MSDIPAILALINGYAANEIMLPRTEFELSEFIRDFTVIYEGDSLIGCAALHFYGPSIAELRSLAVDPAAKGTGAGRLLMEAIDNEAKAFDLSINRYKETKHEVIDHEPPKKIIAKLKKLEAEIAKDLAELEAML